VVENGFGAFDEVVVEDGQERIHDPYRTAYLRAHVEAMGAEHVLFACDYPFSGIKTGIDCLECGVLGKEQLELVYYKNAERLLKNIRL